MKKTTLVCAMLLATLASVPCVATSAMANGARAAESDDATYQVLYRSSPNDSWQVFGTYDNEQDAQDAVNLLKDNGYDAYYKAFS